MRHMYSHYGKKMKVLAVMALLICGLQACSIFPIYDLISFPVKSFGHPRVVDVRLQIIRAGQSKVIDAVVNVGNNELTVIGSAMNVRIFTLKYDGENIIQGSGVGLPFGMPPNLIINDLILIVSDKRLVKANLEKDWGLISGGDNSELLFKKDKLIVKYEKSLDSMGNNVVYLKRYSPEYEIKAVYSEVK
jgi:hypothetical protein